MRSIFEIEFLKRMFRYEPRLGRVVAPLRLETILEMPYWSKKEGFENIWRENLENALRELALHDVSVFNHYVPQLLEASRMRANYCPVLTARNALLDEVSKMERIYG